MCIISGVHIAAIAAAAAAAAAAATAAACGCIESVAIALPFGSRRTRMWMQALLHNGGACRCIGPSELLQSNNALFLVVVRSIAGTAKP